jgi:hypothetical protein
MSRATPTMRKLAERLIKNETWGRKDPNGVSSIFLVTEKLRLPLSTLMGKAGYRAILSRSLTLAQKEVQWLHQVQVGPDGRLQGIGEQTQALSPAQFAESQVVLVAHLLTLLVTFIGAALTVQLIHDIWPSVVTDDLNFGKGN